MNRNFVLLLASFMLMQTSAVQAATQFKVVSMENFSTLHPSKSINLKLPQDVELEHYDMMQNAVLHCNVVKVVEPKRGKRNASFYVQPIYYSYDGKVTNFENDIYAKYSRKLLSKEELKKIKPTKVVKNAALMVGDYFLTGVSVAYNFAEGIVKNEKDNRLKSGVVNAYEESPLSIINEGENLEIKTGDSFYLVFKDYDDKDKANYTYTTPDEQTFESNEDNDISVQKENTEVI